MVFIVFVNCEFSRDGCSIKPYALITHYELFHFASKLS